MVHPGKMPTDASDISSSDYDRYTTTPEEQSLPPPPSPSTPPPTDAIEEGFVTTTYSSMPNSLIDIRLRNVTQISIVPTTLSGSQKPPPPSATQPTTQSASLLNFEGPLLGGDETLRYIAVPPDPLVRTAMRQHDDFASALLIKIRQNETQQLSFHVLDFDFTLLKSKIFSTFSEANRDHFNLQNNSLYFTISPAFAIAWTPTKLEEWISWRDAEDAAGRSLVLQYRVSDKVKLEPDEMEGLRNFLHYNNLYGDKGGDMGGIMACFKQWFAGGYQRLGI